MHKKLHRLLAVGGHVELDETPWQGILHEIREESGYESEQLSVLQPVDRIKQLESVVLHPQPLQLQTHRVSADLDHYHTDFSYVFVTNEKPLTLPGEGESQDIRWFSLLDLDRFRSDITPDIFQIARFCLTIALEKWEKVPIDEYTR